MTDAFEVNGCEQGDKRLIAHMIPINLTTAKEEATLRTTKHRNRCKSLISRAIGRILHSPLDSFAYFGKGERVVFMRPFKYGSAKLAPTPGAVMTAPTEVGSSAVSQNEARAPAVTPPMSEMRRDELQLMHSYSVAKGAQCSNAGPYGPARRTSLFKL
jgi:hypothetical protein